MKLYYRLTKPGIVYGNAMTALAAFVFAAHRHIDIPLLLATVIGISLVIASACVINNVLDRDIDAHMERTKDRAIPTGRVSAAHAYIFALALGVIGFAALFFYTNLLAFFVTLFGFVIYVGAYTPLKRRTLHSTAVGALAGAVPPVVGYVAVTNTLDATAVVLFLILVCWQMIHFLAIAIFRMDEYRAASLPVMPVALGVLPTKAAMTTYAFVFAFAAYVLYATAGLSMLYVWTLGPLAFGWILLSLSGFYAKDSPRWAKRMFFYSIIVLLIFSLVLALS